MAQYTRVARFKAWYKSCWVKNPALMAAMFLPLTAGPLAVYRVIQMKKQGGFSNKYLLSPLVVRPGDTRLKKIHRTSKLDNY